MAKDYYSALGIEKTATHDEVKRAFRKLAHQYHPDKAGGNEQKFKEINEAYQVLGNEQKRKQYDQFGADFQQQGGFGQGMNWDDFMRHARSGDFATGGFSADFGDMGDILSEIFGMSGFSTGPRARRRNRGEDAEVRVDVDIAEVLTGTEKDIELYKTAACKRCGGDGAEPGAGMKKCQLCAGIGHVEQLQRTFLGTMRSRSTCSECRGAGVMPEKECRECTGTGVTKQRSRLNVKIPAGIDDGQMIRLSGEGETAAFGGSTGDLYVRVHMRSHKGLQREGQDIRSDAEISSTQAALGTRVDIETIDGNVELKVPAGIPAGKVLRLKGKGVPRLGGGERGDHFVTVLVKTPTKLSKREKQLFKELAQIRGEKVDTGTGFFGL